MENFRQSDIPDEERSCPVPPNWNTLDLLRDPSLQDEAKPLLTDSGEQGPVKAENQQQPRELEDQSSAQAATGDERQELEPSMQRAREYASELIFTNPY